MSIPTNPFPTEDRASNTHQGPFFQALRWHLEWWIFPEAKTLAGIAERKDLLNAKAMPIGSPPINWNYLDWPEATHLRVFAVSSRFREELKATLRKRSHIKGNIKRLFFQQGDISISFEPFVVPYSDRSIAIYLRTPSLSFPVSSSDLVRLSSHPSFQSSQLRMAVEKICMVLQTGDVNARAFGGLTYRWYPYIHIMDYAPKSDSYGETTHIPWPELVPIGTRHTKISPSDRPLIEAYQAKNHSIRGGVLVIDKQSTLVVSEDDYLELRGIRYCLAVALRMRQLLEREFRSSNEELALTTSLLKRVRFAYERPSVITESQTYRTLWPLIARECQVMEWLSNLEQKSNVQPTPSSATHALPSEQAIAGTTINYTTNIYGPNRGGIQQGGHGTTQSVNTDKED